MRSGGCLEAGTKHRCALLLRARAGCAHRAVFAAWARQCIIHRKCGVLTRWPAPSAAAAAAATECASSACAPAAAVSIRARSGTACEGHNDVCAGVAALRVTARRAGNSRARARTPWRTARVARPVRRKQRLLRSAEKAADGDLTTAGARMAASGCAARQLPLQDCGATEASARNRRAAHHRCSWVRRRRRSMPQRAHLERRKAAAAGARSRRSACQHGARARMPLGSRRGANRRYNGSVVQWIGYRWRQRTHPLAPVSSSLRCALLTARV
jgi:hypothetical protein